jgi:hypothetical protein
MNLQSLFNTVVLEGETVEILDMSTAEYNSLRVALVRKFSAYRSQCMSLGIPGYDDKYLRCNFVNGKDAVFKLDDKTNSPRRPKEYLAKVI